jgi:hypothetical protein
MNHYPLLRTGIRPGYCHNKGTMHKEIDLEF